MACQHLGDYRTTFHPIMFAYNPDPRFLPTPFLIPGILITARSSSLEPQISTAITSRAAFPVQSVLRHQLTFCPRVDLQSIENIRVSRIADIRLAWVGTKLVSSSRTATTSLDLSDYLFPSHPRDALTPTE